MIKEQLSHFILQNKKLMNLLMFLVSALILILFFPEGGKFKYEYQKGKPWMHEVLVAPFDFPIYKSEADLSAEKDSILKNYAPYFNYNPKTGIEQKTRFRTFFANYWDSFDHKHPSALNPGYRFEFEQRILSLFEFD